MDNIDLFHKAASALEQGRPVALVTVVATTGSTPGKVGYKMLVFGDDEGIAGTVGGGLLEAKMIAEARRMLDRTAARVFRFRVGETPDDEKGICGGTVEFLIETFDKTALPLFQELSARVADDESRVLVSILSESGPPRKARLRGDDPAIPFPPEIVEAIRQVAASGGAEVRVSAGGKDVFIESLAAQPIVILFGAGHVASHVARYARLVHFGLVVCDDRAEYANRERFPDADEIVVEDFTRAFDKVRIDGHCYLVIVTRGHRHDGIVLEQAVRTEARYIGMIGSKRKALTLLQNLRDKGVPQERLDRVYAPIGVSIGAVTAEEIGLSIVSELVKIRRLGDGAEIGHMSLSRRGSGL